MNVTNASLLTTAGFGAPSAPAAAAVAAGAAADSFMALLLAQLSHQNPMEPLKDGEMMSQMSQLNSLQELQVIRQAMLEMVSANRAGYAASLLGRNVRADCNGKEVQGTVTGVSIQAGAVILSLGEQDIALSDVIEVTLEAETA